MIRGRMYRRTNKVNDFKQGRSSYVILDLIDTRIYPLGSAEFSTRDFLESCDDDEEWQEIFPGNRNIKAKVVQLLSALARDGYLEIQAERISVDWKGRKRARKEVPQSVIQKRAEKAKAKGLKAVLKKYCPSQKRQKRVLPDDFAEWDAKIKEMGRALKAK